MSVRDKETMFSYLYNGFVGTLGEADGHMGPSLHLYQNVGTDGQSTMILSFHHINQKGAVKKHPQKTDRHITENIDGYVPVVV